MAIMAPARWHSCSIQVLYSAMSAHLRHHVEDSKLPAALAVQVPDPRKGNNNSEHGSKWYKSRKANQNGDADDSQASDGKQDGQEQEVRR